MALTNGIMFMGTPISPELLRALTKCSIDANMSSVTQLTLTFLDPGWVQLSSGIFVLRQRVDTGGYKLEISNISTSDNNGTEVVSLMCRPLAFRLLKDRQGSRVMRNVSPSEFVATECKEAGIGYVVQPSARRSQVARDILENGQKPDLISPPSSWSTFQRLAGELGYVVFECQHVIYFGQPSWLVSSGQLSAFSVGYKTGDIQTNTTPACSRTLDDPQVQVAASVIVNSVDDVRPGKVLKLSGVPTFDGDYLLGGFSADLLSSPNIVDFNAATPKDPEPQPQSR